MVAVDLVYMAVLVTEEAFGSMRTDLCCEERFAVLVDPSCDFCLFRCCLVSSKLVVGVGKLARLAVSAGSVLGDVLA